MEIHRFHHCNWFICSSTWKWLSKSSSATPKTWELTNLNFTRNERQQNGAILVPNCTNLFHSFFRFSILLFFISSQSLLMFLWSLSTILTIILVENYKQKRCNDKIVLFQPVEDIKISIFHWLEEPRSYRCIIFVCNFTLKQIFESCSATPKT